MSNPLDASPDAGPATDSLSAPLSNDISLHGYPPTQGLSGPPTVNPGVIPAVEPPTPAPPPFLPPIAFEPAFRAAGPETLILARKTAERELIGLLVERSGVSQAELARRLGITPQALGQYVKAKRRASFHWLVRLAQVCGARVSVEFPSLAAPIRVRATADEI